MCGMCAHGSVAAGSHHPKPAMTDPLRPTCKTAPDPYLGARAQNSGRPAAVKDHGGPHGRWTSPLIESRQVGPDTLEGHRRCRSAAADGDAIGEGAAPGHGADGPAHSAG